MIRIILAAVVVALVMGASAGWKLARVWDERNELKAEKEQAVNVNTIEESLSQELQQEEGRRNANTEGLDTALDRYDVVSSTRIPDGLRDAINAALDAKSPAAAEVSRATKTR